MSSLFSVFDPQTFMSMSLNWGAALAIIVFLPASFWMINTQIKTTSSVLMKSLFGEFKAIVGSNSAPGMLVASVAAFSFIWANNFLGLMPYVFTATSHLSLTLALALPLWAGHVLLAWARTPNSMMAHLVPPGSPFMLAPFMAVIELTSAVIRPVTLSVRLAANMVAGHLLMVLLSGPASSAPLGLVSLILAALVALVTLECAVATIQAYVFSLLSVLYVNEVKHPTLETFKPCLDPLTAPVYTK